ncbi:hypothetical protein BJ165DRAFT_1534271 [Panaeolus papilionaceus]|nr:hypothetical protein BJ165DRAFT_1534271 [Panaeolus papilionaceus]
MTARSSSTGWIALVDSFIFEVAQPGNPQVSSSPPPQAFPPPSSENGGNGSNSGGNNGNNGSSGGNNGNGGNLGMANSGNNSPPPSPKGSGALSQPISPSPSGLQPSSGLNDGLVLNPSGTTSGASLSPSATDGTVAGANGSSASSPSGRTGSPAAFSRVPHSSDSPFNPLDPSSPTPPSSTSDNHNHKKKFPIGVIVGVICGILLLLVIRALIVYYVHRRRRIREAAHAEEDHHGAQDKKISKKDGEMQQKNPFDDVYNISSATVPSNVTSRPNDSNDNSPLETAANTSYLGETSPASPPTATTLGFRPWILYHRNRRALSSSTTSSRYSRSSNALDEGRPTYVQGTSDSAGVVVAGPQNFMQSQSATLCDTTNISTDRSSYVNSATGTSPRNPSSIRPTPSAWTRPRKGTPPSDSDAEFIETTDLVPVHGQFDQGRELRGVPRHDAPQTISLSLPSPLNILLVGHSSATSLDELQLSTQSGSEGRSPSPSPHRSSNPESQLSRGLNRMSGNSAITTMLLTARANSNIFGHHPTRSQLSLWSSADLATPPPQYCSRESRTWDQFDDGTGALAHKLYVRQHQELMRSLEGYLSSTVSPASGVNMQLDINNCRVEGELPTPPASERGGKSGK